MSLPSVVKKGTMSGAYAFVPIIGGVYVDDLKNTKPSMIVTCKYHITNLHDLGCILNDGLVIRAPHKYRIVISLTLFRTWYICHSHFMPSIYISVIAIDEVMVIISSCIFVDMCCYESIFNLRTASRKCWNIVSYNIYKCIFYRTTCRNLNKYSLLFPR